MPFYLLDRSGYSSIPNSKELVFELNYHLNKVSIPKEGDVALLSFLGEPQHLAFIGSGINSANYITARENNNGKYFECLYFDKARLYQPNLLRVSNNTGDYRNRLIINSNLVSSAQIIEGILTYLERRCAFKFYLPLSYIYLEAGDVVKLLYNSTQYYLKITTIKKLKGIIEVIAYTHGTAYAEKIVASVFSEELINHPNSSYFNYSDDYAIEILDIPNFQNINELLPVVYVAATVKSGKFRPFEIEYTDNPISNAYQYTDNITEEATMGTAECVSLASNVKPENIDYVSAVKIYLSSGSLSSVDYESIVNDYRANLAVIGEEIIQFMDVKKIADHEYIISGLKRGCLSTEQQISLHSVHERFVVLNQNLHAIALPIHVYNNKCKYRVFDTKTDSYNIKGEFTWKARSIKPLSPVHIKFEIDEHKKCHINWIRRAKINGGLQSNIEVPLECSEERYGVILESANAEQVFYKEVTTNKIIIDLGLLNITKRLDIWSMAKFNYSR